MQPSLGVVVAAVVVVVVETVLLSRPHWHKPSTSHGHQDCPPKAHGAQWSSVAACVFPGTAAHVLQLMQLSLARVVVEAVLLVEVGGVVAAVVVVVEEAVLLVEAGGVVAAVVVVVEEAVLLLLLAVVVAVVTTVTESSGDHTSGNGSAPWLLMNSSSAKVFFSPFNNVISNVIGLATPAPKSGFSHIAESPRLENSNSSWM